MPEPSDKPPVGDDGANAPAPPPAQKPMLDAPPEDIDAWFAAQPWCLPPSDAFGLPDDANQQRHDQN